jgi:hypothetical protein
MQFIYLGLDNFFSPFISVGNRNRAQPGRHNSMDRMWLRADDGQLGSSPARRNARYSEKPLPSWDPMLGVGRELLVRSFGNVLARIHHVMVRFLVPRQTRAFVEPVFAESTSAKRVV